MSTKSVKSQTKLDEYESRIKSSKEDDVCAVCNDVSDSLSKEAANEHEDFKSEQEFDSAIISGRSSRLQRSLNTYPNKTFTPDQIRNIERTNVILMNKILSYNHRPSQHRPPKTMPNYHYKTTSAAINRKKDQDRIDWENQVF